MEYKELKEFLIKCSNSYYKDSISLISDYEFDMKMKELERLEEEQGYKDDDSPSNRVGSDLLKNPADENIHKRPMLSLENTYSEDEVESWFSKLLSFTKTPSVCVEPKIDGGSCAIRFRNGKVEKALTRGSGEVGEDITQNVSFLDFSNISKNFSGEVRGELVITKEGFSFLNRNGDYQNARNLLSGSMKLLDPEEFKQRAPHIVFIAYWNEEFPTKSHYRNIKALHDAGFTTTYPDSKVVNSFSDLKKAIDFIEQNKQDFFYEIDGAVMKLDNTELWEIIGSTAKAPRWAKAYKYKQEQVKTLVHDIRYEVGRTGKITPLCIFAPVTVDGSSISKATLNNKDFMDKMNIGKGDVIVVQKAACIIPQVVEVSDRSGRYEKAKFPSKCPVCGTKLVKYDESHADYYCPNVSCSARICDTILNFTHAMKIDGFAEIVIEKIHNARLLNSISDLYRLKDRKAKLLNLERFGEKMVDNLLANIESSKTQSLDKLIAGLSIRNVGPKLSKTLAKHFKSLKVLQSASKDELMEIDDIGEIVADSILDYFADQRNKVILKDLEDFGLKFEIDEVKVEGDKPNINLTGKVFCITGALSLKRETYIEMIEMLGGKVSGAVSNKTSYLITNDKTTNTKKNIAARQLGIPILNEEELLEMCQALHLMQLLKGGN